MKGFIQSNFLAAIAALLVFMIISIVMIFSSQPKPTQRELQARANPEYSKAYFAGGCFWCVESDFEKFKGVKAVISGYSGGDMPNPTYEDHADHREAVEVVYDASIISYQDLVEYFYRHHDPTDEGGSFYDRGHSYTSAIYYQNEKEKKIAEMVTMELEKAQVFDKPIATAIEEFKNFTDAEDYHQDYHSKNPLRYKAYRTASGRDARFKDIETRIEGIVKQEAQNTDANVDFEQQTFKTISDWSKYQKPSEEVLRSQLSELEYRVTQEEGTEMPFSEGNLNDEKRPGIFVDILSGEPLFSSRDKFESGTGWPSFTQPIDEEFIVEKKDFKLVWPRTEIRSRYGDNHLGHVFNDGPRVSQNGEAPTGLRYCMNGAAMRFIPLEEMKELGYGNYIDKVK